MTDLQAQAQLLKLSGGQIGRVVHGIVPQSECGGVVDEAW